MSGTGVSPVREMLRVCPLYRDEAVMLEALLTAPAQCERVAQSKPVDCASGSRVSAFRGSSLESAG